MGLAKWESLVQWDQAAWRAGLPHMRGSRRAKLPGGARRMGKAGFVGPGSERYGGRAGLERGGNGT